MVEDIFKLVCAAAVMQCGAGPCGGAHAPGGTSFDLFFTRYKKASICLELLTVRVGRRPSTRRPVPRDWDRPYLS